MKYLKLVMLGAVIGVLLALAQGVLADEPLERDNAVVTDNNLKKFAVAFVEVRDLGSSFYDDFSSAETEEEALALQQEVRRDIKEAVEDAGLTVEQYDFIANEMSKNPELFMRIEEMI